MPALPRAADHRKADHPIEAIFINRWSPRAMSGRPIDDAALHCLFEAARWAPSSYNEQPWRFLYAKRDTPAFAVFLDLLFEGNQLWCKNAAALILVVSSKTFSHNGKPNAVFAYDAGAAWENLALQGAHMGLVVHGMAGFNMSKAKAALNVPDSFEVMAMAAVGHPGDPAGLPEPMRKMEVPSGRKPVAEIAMEGGFKA